MTPQLRHDTNLNPKYLNSEGSQLGGVPLYKGKLPSGQIGLTWGPRMSHLRGVSIGGIAVTNTFPLCMGPLNNSITQ